MILYFLPTALLPDKDQHESADTRNGEADNSDYLSFCFRNDEIRCYICCNLRKTNCKSVDIEIEFKLIKHEARSVEAEADDAEK